MISEWNVLCVIDHHSEDIFPWSSWRYVNSWWNSSKILWKYIYPHSELSLNCMKTKITFEAMAFNADKYLQAHPCMCGGVRNSQRYMYKHNRHIIPREAFTERLSMHGAYTSTRFRKNSRGSEVSPQSASHVMNFGWMKLSRIESHRWK